MKILLIQDVLLMPTNAKMILSKFGQVTEINDGFDAINKFTTSHRNDLGFDVIFIDVILPGMSGIDIVKYIRKVEKDPTINRSFIVMVSLPGHNINIQELIDAGADKVFTKPITHESVEEYFKEIKLIE
jgi:CheY-like chemotaxis protein